jgi:3-dehydroquinate dehydratase type I
VIGSYHLVQKTLDTYSDFEVQTLFHDCAKGPAGTIDIVKVVGKAADVHCSIRIHQAALEAKQTLPATVSSIIAINTTDPGRLSRALNVMLGPTPVAHASLPGKAAPGQLSALDIERCRTTLGLDANPFTAPQ